MSLVSAPTPDPPPVTTAAGVPPRHRAAAGAAQVISELRRLAGESDARAASASTAQPTAWQKVLAGLLQPLHAANLLMRDRELLLEALLPAMLLLGFCLSMGFFKALLFSEEPGFVAPMLKTALGSFVVLAPMPSIIMANHYGRLCAQAHERMQLGSCKPRHRSIWSSAMLALRQIVVVAVVVLPLSLTAGLLPWVGGWVAKVLLLIWALHWIVVEALDDGGVEVVAVKQSQPQPIVAPQHPSPGPWTPWFLWPVHQVGVRLPSLPGAPLRFFVRRSGWLCTPWRHEITLVERNLPVMLGFAATTAVLLCTPVLNLVFRPITVVAAVRLIGQLRLAEPGASPTSPALAAQPGQGPC